MCTKDLCLAMRVSLKAVSPTRGVTDYVNVFLFFFQQQYNLLARQSEFEEFMVCKNEGIGVLPWSPLKGYFFLFVVLQRWYFNNMQNLVLMQL